MSHTPSHLPRRTPGFKSILIADAAYHGLKAYQSWESCSHLPVRFDLKDIATAFVEEALAIPGFKDRVLQRAFNNVSRVVAAATQSPVPVASPKSKE